MYTRNVSMKLKVNSAKEFTQTLENDVIPVLRKQKGFKDEITLIAPERNDAVAISFWDRKEDAEAYKALRKWSPLRSPIRLPTTSQPKRPNKRAFRFGEGAIPSPGRN